MLYKISNSIPANTAINSPEWNKLKICKGTITQWIIFCPDEAADLMKFRISYHGQQILPIPEGEWMDPLRNNVPIAENIEVDESPYILDVYAYNLDDSYEHEYNVYVNVLREKPYKPGSSGFDLKGAWNRLFGGGT